MKIFKNEELNQKLYYKKSNKGLDVYFMPKKGFTKQYASFSTRYGSIDNKFVPLGEDEIIEVPEGIAHFLEHKLFEEPDINVFDKFSKLGSSANAFTSFTQTSYLFSSTEKFYENLKLLVKFVQNPYFTDENIQKEKGIIAQEIKMYEDDASWRVFFNALNALYHNHPVKIDIAGTVESIQKIDKDLLYTCYRTFYNNSNMNLFIVGDLSFDQIMKEIESVEVENLRTSEDIKRIFPNEPEKINKKLIEEEMATSNPLFYIGFKDLNLGLEGREDVKKDMISNILLDMLFGESSEFYNELYSKGEISSHFGAYYTGNYNFGHSFVVGEADNPKKIYQNVIEHISKPCEQTLDIESFNRVKSNEIGNFIMNFDSVDYIGNIGANFALSDFNILDYLDLLREIEFKDIIERYNEHLNEDNSILSIINPEKRM